MVREVQQPQTDTEGPGAAFPKRCQPGKLTLNVEAATVSPGNREATRKSRQVAWGGHSRESPSQNSSM